MGGQVVAHSDIASGTNSQGISPWYVRGGMQYLAVCESLPDELMKDCLHLWYLNLQRTHLLSDLRGYRCLVRVGVGQCLLCFT